MARTSTVRKEFTTQVQLGLTSSSVLFQVSKSSGYFTNKHQTFEGVVGFYKYILYKGKCRASVSAVLFDLRNQHCLPGLFHTSPKCVLHFKKVKSFMTNSDISIMYISIYVTIYRNTIMT